MGAITAYVLLFCSGSFATVKKGECRSDGSTWAIKCIEKAKMQKEDEEALRVEVAILEKVRHDMIMILITM